jgi:hypothetical protein
MLFGMGGDSNLGFAAGLEANFIALHCKKWSARCLLPSLVELERPQASMRKKERIKAANLAPCWPSSLDGNVEASVTGLGNMESKMLLTVSSLHSKSSKRCGQVESSCGPRHCISTRLLL